jgi:hypothetical protein
MLIYFIISMTIMSNIFKEHFGKYDFLFICNKFFELFLMAYKRFLLSLIVSEIFMIENWPFLYFW